MLGVGVSVAVGSCTLLLMLIDTVELLRRSPQNRFLVKILVIPRKILVKSPKPVNKMQRKVDYYAITMRRNYYRKL